ncbi:hypothetical protein D3C81_1354240 [compost metagenome]
MDDRAQVKLLGGDQREALVEVEAHLPTKHAARAGAGAVGLLTAMLEYVLQQIQILLHAFSPVGRTGCRTGARRDISSRTTPSAINGRLRICPRVSQSKAT